MSTTEQSTITLTIDALEAVDRLVRTGTITPKQLAATLVDLDTLLGAAKDVRATVAKILIDTLGEGGAVSLGRTKVAVARSAPTWAYEGRKLVKLVAARASDLAVDRETGEVLPPAVFAELVAEEVMRYSGIDNASHKGWRVAEFTKAGIQINDYRTEKAGQLKVEVK